MSQPPLHLSAAPPEERLPTRWAALLFRAKASCFQLRRRWQDSRGGPARHHRAETLTCAPVRGEWQSDLWHESAAPRERRLMLGKVQNLRAAAARLDGVEVPAGAVFSFWKQVGRATRRRGFAAGRELREGCLIPTVGGGLCQLSGALYNAALEAGLEIVERHGHSTRGVSTLARVGRDATVFWNYVDLRLRSPFPWRLEVWLSHDHLHVAIRSTESAPAKARVDSEESTAAPPPNSCATCGLSDCFRHAGGAAAQGDSTAWLVDECWPEFADLLRREEAQAGLLCRPMDGRLWRKPAYAWPAEKFQQTHNATWLALRRAWAVRRLREQGAARQRALLAWDERLAAHFACRLRPEHTHLVVAQSLIPFLWRDGVLGGRTFDVLMQRLPMDELQHALDTTAALHPESHTCADFRAQTWLVGAETQALAAARRWITPHANIAALTEHLKEPGRPRPADGPRGEGAPAPWGASRHRDEPPLLSTPRANLLPWKLPEACEKPHAPGRRVVFPASTLCRKGAYELRAAARALDLEVVCLGGILEGADFWAGVRLVESRADWLDEVVCVVLPAFVEHRPRRLLQAIAAGVPVIATVECGLPASPLVKLVPAGNVEALIAALGTLDFCVDRQQAYSPVASGRISSTRATPVVPS